jgi:FMN reductase
MTTVVAGNPKPMWRTRAAAEMVAEKLTGARPDHVIDVIDLGAGLLDRWRIHRRSRAHA